jgi:hypothetical protein
MQNETDRDEIKVLRQHVEDMFAMHTKVHELEDKALILAKQNADVSLKTALASMDARLEGMNEFRATVSDLVGKAVTRLEYDAAHRALDAKYDDRFLSLEKDLVALRNDVIQSGALQRGGYLVKDEGRSNVIMVVSAIGVLLALLTAGVTGLIYIIGHLPPGR